MKVTIAALGLSALVGCSTIDNLKKDTIKVEDGRNVLICNAGERVAVKYDPFDANETVIIRTYHVSGRYPDLEHIFVASGSEYERFCGQMKVPEMKRPEGCAERSSEVRMAAELAYLLTMDEHPNACDPLLRALYLK